MKKLILPLILGLIIGGLSLFSFQASDNTNVGVDLPQAPALFESSLAAPITATADSFTLTSNSVRGGGTLSGYNCFTIDEGSAQAEFVCGNASGTAVTGVSRGISPSDGTSEVAALQFSHRRGASVQITDFPIIQLLRAQNNGSATFENVLQYAGSVVPSSANDLADVGYVLSVVNGGDVNFDALVVAGNAGETVATGTLVYFDATDQEWKKVDTDTSATYVRVPVGITQGAGTNGNPIQGGGVLIAGRDTTQSGLTLGDDYYAGSTAGVLSTTESGLLIGRAGDSATELYVWPQLNESFLDLTFSGVTDFTGESLKLGLINVLAGETINGATLPVPVYMNPTDNEVYAMDGNATSTHQFFGFAITNSTNGNTIMVQREGIVDGFSALDEARAYFVSDTAGAITATPATYHIQVGIAASPTELIINKGRLFAAGTITVDGSATTDYTRTIGFRPRVIRIFAADGNSATELSTTYCTWVNGTLYSSYGSITLGGAAGSSCRIDEDLSGETSFVTFSILSTSNDGFIIRATEDGTVGVMNIPLVWEAEGDY